MFQTISGYQNQVIITHFLNAVPHDPVHTAAVLNKVKLILLMGVDGIIELAFVPLNNVEAVFVGDGRNFPEYVGHNSISVSDTNIEIF